MGYEMWKTPIAIALTLAATAGIMAAASASTAPTVQDRCEAWQRQYLTAVRDDEQPPPYHGACTAMTDAQWMVVNRHLDALHNEVVHG